MAISDDFEVGGEVLGAAEDAGAGGVDLLWLMCAGKCILARVSEGEEKGRGEDRDD